MFPVPARVLAGVQQLSPNSLIPKTSPVLGYEEETVVQVMVNLICQLLLIWVFPPPKLNRVGISFQPLQPDRLYVPTLDHAPLFL